jgi:hypothetical protein
LGGKIIDGSHLCRTRIRKGASDASGSAIGDGRRTRAFCEVLNDVWTELAKGADADRGTLGARAARNEKLRDVVRVDAHLTHNGEIRSLTQARERLATSTLELFASLRRVKPERLKGALGLFRYCGGDALLFLATSATSRFKNLLAADAEKASRLSTK